eukprot:PhF_6_TR29628/c0_g1_i1/m.43739
MSSLLEKLQQDLTAADILLCSSEELREAYPGLTPAESLKAIATARRTLSPAQPTPPAATERAVTDEYESIDTQARIIWEGFNPPPGSHRHRREHAPSTPIMPQTRIPSSARVCNGVPRRHPPQISLPT